jgi:hypothetical protein
VAARTYGGLVLLCYCTPERVSICIRWMELTFAPYQQYDHCCGLIARSYCGFYGSKVFHKTNRSSGTGTSSSFNTTFHRLFGFRSLRPLYRAIFYASPDEVAGYKYLAVVTYNNRFSAAEKVAQNIGRS